MRELVGDASRGSMNALQRKEARLQSELDEAMNYTDRKRIRAELRELRLSIKGEKEAVDLNSNSIPYNKHASSGVADTPKSLPNESLRLNDCSEEVRQTSADERLARRERRKQRQSRLARETEDQKSVFSSASFNSNSKATTIAATKEETSSHHAADGGWTERHLRSSKIVQKSDDGISQQTKVESRTTSVSGGVAFKTMTATTTSSTNLVAKPNGSNRVDGKAKDRLGRVLSVGMMREKFGALASQSPNHKPVEFGTSYIKPATTKPVDPSPSRTYAPVSAPKPTSEPKSFSYNKPAESKTVAKVESEPANAKVFSYKASESKASTYNRGTGVTSSETRSSFVSRRDAKEHTGQEIKVETTAIVQKTQPSTSISIEKASGASDAKTTNKPNGSSSISNNESDVQTFNRAKPTNVSLRRTPSQLISAALDRKMNTNATPEQNNNNTVQLKDDPPRGKKPLEFKAEPVRGRTTGPRETFVSQSAKQDAPDEKPRNAPAPGKPTIGRSSMSFSFGSNGGTRHSDRLRYFREAAEKEKARKERLKEQKLKEEEEPKPAAANPSNNTQSRERLASAPAAIEDSSNKDTRSAAPCMKKREQKRPVRRTMSISSIVLDWCKEMVRDYGIQVKNFSSSWNDGMAFCALIHRFHPDAFDFQALSPVNREHNFKTAFETAYNLKNVPMLLDVEDMVNLPNPEPRSVQCYIQWIWSVYGPISGYGPSQAEVKQAQCA